MRHRFTCALVGVVTVGSLLFQPQFVVPSQAQVSVSSVRDGRWSESGTWSTGRVPQRGEWVTVVAGHTVTYDVHSDVEIGRLLVRGTLTFSRDRLTRLDVGNVIVERGGYLEMGTPAAPIPATASAELRFVVPGTARCAGGMGFVEGDTGLWVMGGGRWEAHGTPVRVTWTKLVATATPGTSVLRVADDVTDWTPGAWVVVTPTDVGRRFTVDALNYRQYEEFQVVRATRRVGYTELQISGGLLYLHEASPNVAGEVALLSRNVVVTSKYPNDELNGHTLFMAEADGGLSYVELRELGGLGCVGRYPLHFHMMGDSARGIRVRGASIWRSDHNFLNIHGSSGVTIEDTVGYNATGVGYFIGEPAEGMPSVDNVLVNNLAARVIYREGALPEHRHRVAGFWIHSFNAALVGNVASGSWGVGGSHDAGFHLAERSPTTPGAAVLVMVRNESHSNNGSGFDTWTNSTTTFRVVDLRAWRNGFAGVDWGAYRNLMQIHRSLLFENATYNLRTTSTETYLADSTLMATAVVPAAIGFLIDGYFIANDPSRPARMFRNTFAGHQIHLSQDHSACSSAAEQFDPLSRACAAVYQILAGNRMDGGRAFDFGWQRNANSWFVVQDPSGTSARPAAGPHFRLTRRDRPRPDTDAFIDPGADAWADPLPGPLYAAPPHATLSGVVDDQALGSAVTLLVTPSGSVARVTYYADEVELGSQTAAPFRLTWASGAWTRRYAHVYAMVTDAQGNSAFTQVIRLQRFSVGSPPTPAPTSTPGPTPTSVITPTPTRTATPGPTPTRTVTPGPTPTRTATPGPTPTRTATPGPTPTRTPTPRRTATPTATPRPEPEGRAITAGSEAGAPSGSGQTFSVQVGAYADPANAQARVAELRRAGFRPVVVSDGRLLRVYAGTFVQRAQAEQFAQQLRIRGYRAVITP